MVFGGESGDLHIWEANTLKEVSRTKGHSGEPMPAHGLYSVCVCVCMCVSVCACVHACTYLTVARASEDALSPYVAGAVMCLNLSQDGTTLISGSKDRCVGVWAVS